MLKKSCRSLKNVSQKLCIDLWSWNAKIKKFQNLACKTRKRTARAKQHTGQLYLVVQDMSKSSLNKTGLLLLKKTSFKVVTEFQIQSRTKHPKKLRFGDAAQRITHHTRMICFNQHWITSLCCRFGLFNLFIIPLTCEKFANKWARWAEKFFLLVWLTPGKIKNILFK